MPTITYYNGEFLEQGKPAVPVEERGHQFGDGVYEVVRIYAGRPFLLDWHMERLERSLSVVGLENPMTREEWVSLIHDAIRRSNEPEANVYFHVTRGIAPRNHLFPSCSSAVSLTVRPVNLPVHHGSGDKSEGSPNVQVLAWPDERWANAYVKSINLLPNVIAKEAAHRANAHEAMLVRQGKITECSGSNVWFVKDGELWTHPANRFILGGITRRFVLQLADELNIPVHEEAVVLCDLASFQQAFISGTTNEILPIDEIIVHRARESSLIELPDAPPLSLLETDGEVRTLWQKSPDDASLQALQRLIEAYKAHVSTIRNGAVTAP